MHLQAAQKSEELKAQAKSSPFPESPSDSIHCIDRESLLVLEYDLLKKYLIPGVYVLPHYEENRTSAVILWDGMIFVKSGPYRNGKFSFIVCFREDYPRTPPRVQFHPRMYHPLINAEDGTLDVQVMASTNA